MKRQIFSAFASGVCATSAFWSVVFGDPVGAALISILACANLYAAFQENDEVRA